MGCLLHCSPVYRNGSWNIRIGLFRAVPQIAQEPGRKREMDYLASQRYPHWRICDQRRVRVDLGSVI